MSTITFGGLASGLDTKTIVSELVSAQSQPLNQLKSKQADVDNAAQALTSISSLLGTLRNAASALADPVQFASFSATTSDSAIVASATGAAQPGAYDVQVDALAQEQRTYSDAQTSATSALGMSGTLDITIGSTKTTVNVGSGESLSDVAASINGSGARVSASVLFDGTSYRLQVRGLDTGASNAVTFGENGFSLGLGTTSNTVQKAQDAKIELDGFTITRSTNSVVGVVPGVTLALTQTTTSPVTVQVQSDPKNVEQKLQTFVSAYNNVIQAGHQAAGYGSQKAQIAALQGDSTVRSMLDRLGALVGQPISNTSGAYDNLGAVGITTNNDGTLALDTSKFEDALAKDPTAVSKLFVKDPSISANGVMASFQSTIDLLSGNADSLVTTAISSLQTKSKSMSDDEDAMQRQIDAYQARLQAQFTQLELNVNKYKSLESAISNANFPGFGSSSGSGSSSSG